MGDITKLLICTLGIYTCYLGYGLAQEGVYKPTEKGEKFGFTAFLLLAQCFTNAVFALIIMAYKAVAGSEKSAPALMPILFSFSPILMSGSYVCAMFCSNEALKFVSYPTQAVGKSCKMVPVMLMGVILGTKKYGFMDYFNVVLITAGIVMFNLAKSKSGGENSSVGLALLFTSLVLDGTTGSVQEGIQGKHKTTSTQMMFLCNFWAIIFAGGACIAQGQLEPALAFVANNPDFQTKLAIFSLASALGQNFIFLTIQWFSALTCSTITTTRKFFTVLASVFYYGHTLKQQQWVGTGLVFLGIGINMSLKYAKSQKAAAAKGKKD
jgi:UDP-galactose transporter B1